MEDRERERSVVAKLLIACRNNKTTGMLNMSKPIEAYPSEGFKVKPGGTGLDETRCSVDL